MKLRLLFVGDIVGHPGRRMLAESLPKLRQRHNPDFIVVNGENAAGGNGLTPAVYAELVQLGVNAITLGNHAWDKKELLAAIDDLPLVVRPANYPEGTPGRGGAVLAGPAGLTVGVINVMGRVFNPLHLDCPFRTTLREIDRMRSRARVILVDLHAEATSEKQAMAWYLDGRVSVLVGTHTHVQTADASVLPHGTAYVTDVGMTGPWRSAIGVDPERVVERFLSQRPISFQVAKGPCQLNAAVCDIDEASGLARGIELIAWREPLD